MTEIGFDAALREWLPGLARYATALTGDPDLAGDLVQDVMLRAHRQWSRVSGADRPDLYLKRMITNEFLSWRRRWYSRNVVSVDGESLDLNSRATDHASLLVERDAMLAQLATLPRRQRAVLTLRYYEQLTDAEIAEVLGVSAGTVRSTASRALAALRSSHLLAAAGRDL